VKKFTHHEPGLHQNYTIHIHSDAKALVHFEPDQSYTYGVNYSADMNGEPPVKLSFAGAETKRGRFLSEMQEKLILNTTEPVLNILFNFSKIRAAKMEGRIPTSDANLSTSSLYYCVLIYAVRVAAALGNLKKLIPFSNTWNFFEFDQVHLFGTNLRFNIERIENEGFSKQNRYHILPDKTFYDFFLLHSINVLKYKIMGGWAGQVLGCTYSGEMEYSNTF
jgi:hypothetical protein